MALTTIDTYGIKDGAVQIDDIGTLAGNLTINDSGKLRLGTGLDLQLYHDGSHSYIKDTGTGNLQIASGQTNIQDADLSHYQAKFIDGGAVELYHAGSKKFQTTASGTHCFGQLEMDGSNNIDLQDNGALLLGTSDDLQIFHDGSHSKIKNTTGFLVLESDSFTLNNGAGNESIIKGYADGAVELYYNNVKKLATVSDGVEVWGDIHLQDSNEITLGVGQDFKLYHTGSHNIIEGVTSGQDLYIGVRNEGDEVGFLKAPDTEWMIRAIVGGSSSLYYDGTKKLETASDGVDVAGHLHLTGDSNYLKLGAAGTGDLQLYHDGTNNIINAVNGDIKIFVKDGENAIKCIRDGAVELYYDNSKKFSTQSGGIKFYGDVFTNDANFLKLGTNQDLWVGHDGSHSYINHNGTGALFVQSSGGFYVQKYGTTERLINANNDGNVELFYDGARKLYTTSTGIVATDQLTVNGNINAAQHIKFPDNKTAYFGTSDDLQIYHDGTNSILKSDTGELKLMTDSFRIRSNNNSETLIRALKDGAVELFYDDSKKFETTSWGAQVVSGNFACTGGGDMFLEDDGVLYFGTGNDFYMYHDGSQSHIRNDNGQFIIRSDILKLKNKDNDEMYMECTDNGSVDLYYDGTKKLETTADGIAATGGQYTGELILKTNDGIQRGRIYSSSGSWTTFKSGHNETYMQYIYDGGVELYYNAAKKFETTSAGGTLHGTWTGAGRILQVVQDVKSDGFTTTSADTSFVDITNFNQAITPSSSSNKVLVRINIGKCACSQNSRQTNFRVLRGSTEIGRGDAYGSRIRCAFSIYHGGMNGSGGGWSGSWEYLDSPSTTSSTTYKVQMAGHNGDTHGINGAYSDNSNNTDGPQSRTISTITLMEVSA